MLNNVVLMGRLTAAPELRYTQSNTPVASFTLACERDYVASSGGQKETDFINCVAWRGTGEFINKYFGKGDMAVVVGRLQVREYTDRNGDKRRATEVIADHIYFGGSKKTADKPAQGVTVDYGDTPSPRYNGTTGYAGFSAGQSAFAELEDEDQDLPF